MITVEDLFNTCYSRWEIDVDIRPNIKLSGDRYDGCMAETPWYLIDKPVESWWFNKDGILEVVIDEK